MPSHEMPHCSRHESFGEFVHGLETPRICGTGDKRKGVPCFHEYAEQIELAVRKLQQ